MPWGRMNRAAASHPPPPTGHTAQQSHCPPCDANLLLNRADPARACSCPAVRQNDDAGKPCIHRMSIHSGKSRGTGCARGRATLNSLVTLVAPCSAFLLSAPHDFGCLFGNVLPVRAGVAAIHTEEAHSRLGGESLDQLCLATRWRAMQQHAIRWVTLDEGLCFGAKLGAVVDPQVGDDPAVLAVAIFGVAEVIEAGPTPFTAPSSCGSWPPPRSHRLDRPSWGSG